MPQFKQMYPASRNGSMGTFGQSSQVHSFVIFCFDQSRAQLIFLCLVAQKMRKALRFAVNSV